MNVVQILRADGGVSVIAPHASVPLDAAREVAAWTATADPAWLPVVSFAVVDSSVVPTKRFRAAWRHAAGVVTVYLPTARALRKAELLADRDARLDRVLKKMNLADVADDAPNKTKHKKRVKDLLALDATLDAQLAAIADAAALDAFTPPELQPAD